MALSQIPPWLSVSPSDFVKAASMGAQAGLAVARMNQAAGEAAANRAQRGNEFAAQQQLRQFERQMQMQMQAEQLQAQREKAQAELQARMAYNMSNLGLRQQALAAQEEKAKQTFGFREKAEGRLQEGLGLEKTRVQQAADREKRLAEQAANPAPKYMTETIEASPGSPAVPAVPAIPYQKKSLFGIDALWPDQQAVPGTPAIPAVPAHGALRIPRAIPPGLQGATAPAAPAAFPAAPKSPKDREKGASYEIPGKGPYTWNGDAWERYVPPPQNDQSSVGPPMPEDELQNA